MHGAWASMIRHRSKSYHDYVFKGPAAAATAATLPLKIYCENEGIDCRVPYQERANNFTYQECAKYFFLFVFRFFLFVLRFHFFIFFLFFDISRYFFIFWLQL